MLLRDEEREKEGEATNYLYFFSFVMKKCMKRNDIRKGGRKGERSDMNSLVINDRRVCVCKRD